MQTPKIAVRPGKTQFSEIEAAEELGLPLDQFRALIRSHIVQTEEEFSNVAIASFHPSDLLILKLLAKAQAASA